MARDPSLPLVDLVTTSDAVACVRARRQKIDLLAALLCRVPVNDLEIAVGLLTGEPRQGRVGLGPATVVAARDTPPAERASLTLVEVAAALDGLLQIRGPGSVNARSAAWRALLSRAVASEQDFLARLALGELRQSALEGWADEGDVVATHARPSKSTSLAHATRSGSVIVVSPGRVP